MAQTAPEIPMTSLISKGTRVSLASKRRSRLLGPESPVGACDVVAVSRSLSRAFEGDDRGGFASLSTPRSATVLSAGPLAPAESVSFRNP